MAMILSLLVLTSQSRWFMARPPHPIKAQLSFRPGLSAARMFGPRKRATADRPPVARAVRLRNERRFNVDFMRLQGSWSLELHRLQAQYRMESRKAQGCRTEFFGTCDLVQLARDAGHKVPCLFHLR